MEKGFDFSALPVVGREEIQERLLSGLQAALNGKGRTLLLTGERGTGKTHLFRYLRGEAERKGFSVAAGRAYRAEAGVPYSLFSDAFLPLLRSQPPESLTVLTRGGTPELAHLFPSLASSGNVARRVETDSPGELRTRVL